MAYRREVRTLQSISLPVAPIILIREETPLPERYVEPFWARELVDEWGKRPELVAVGAYPTQSVLLRGPSGVGKTTSARWISQKLKMPLFSLSMARTIDSYMGVTGKNIESALRYAMDSPVMILVDEIDAIAASRQMKNSDVGEIWRITNTFIQEMDRWHQVPRNSLLIATTNMSDKDIDTAIVRRFELQVEIPLPSAKELSRISGVAWPEEFIVSHAVCRRMVLQAKRRSILASSDYELTLGAMISRGIAEASNDPF
jgi:AAA+ superfamily predicted ATPase